MLRKNKDDLNKWNDIFCLQVVGANIVEKEIITKLTYRFNTIQIKILAAVFFFSVENEPVLNILWKSKESRITKDMLRKKEHSLRTYPSSIL